MIPILSKRNEGIVNNFRNLESTRMFTAMDNKIVIQYWFFYLNNYHIFDHEGDWEMIQIVCDENGNPQKAGYSQHYGGDKRSWSNVEKVDGNHPKVYVALGGHASYFESGIKIRYIPIIGIYIEDIHFGNGEVMDSSDYNIRLINNEPWLRFRGRWGEDTFNLGTLKSYSPEGPVFRYSRDTWGIGSPKAYMWVEPIYWSDTL